MHLRFGRFQEMELLGRLSASVVRVTGTFSRNSMLVSLWGERAVRAMPSDRYSFQSIESSSTGSAASRFACSSGGLAREILLVLDFVHFLEQRVLQHLLLPGAAATRAWGYGSSFSACWRRGVMMSDCRCVRWEQVFHFHGGPSLERGSFAEEIVLPRERIPSEFGRARRLDAAVGHDVRTSVVLA